MLSEHNVYGFQLRVGGKCKLIDHWLLVIELSIKFLLSSEEWRVDVFNLSKHLMEHSGVQSHANSIIQTLSQVPSLTIA